MRPGNRLNNPENNNLNTTLSNQFDIMAATTITTTPSMATMATISGTKIELLNHENYFSWAPRARAICKKEGQWKYIDPARQSGNEELTGSKKEAYEDAKDWLELMISDEVVQDLVHLGSGAEVWTFLENKYTQMQASQQSLYLQRLESVVFDDQKEELRGFINRISRLIAQFLEVHNSVAAGMDIARYYVECSVLMDIC